MICDQDLGAYCLEIADVKKRLSDLLDDVERGVRLAFVARV